MSMRRRHLSALLLAAPALLFSATVAAQIYECTDARGARQFTHFCPPGTVSQRLVGRGEEPPVAPESKSAAQQDVEFRKRMQERADAEAKAAENRGKTEEAERNCTQAQAQYKALVEGQRMQRIDPETGERIFLSDEERAADAARQQKLVEQWCK